MHGEKTEEDITDRLIRAYKEEDGINIEVTKLTPVRRYRDLENNNSNFVNLLELKVNRRTLLNIMCECCCFDEDYIFDRTNILECVLGLLKGKNSNAIKQAIKQADWSWK